MLLWFKFKAWDPEGLPPAECILAPNGAPVAADPTSPEYRARLDRMMAALLVPAGGSVGGLAGGSAGGSVDGRDRPDRVGRRGELPDPGRAPQQRRSTGGRVSQQAGSAPGAPVRRATIKDVADRAGVSRSTASRALTGVGYVSPERRRQVQQAADELRYVPDAMARSLKQQVSRTLGVLVSDLRNPFYADLAAGAGHSSRAAGYTMLLVDDGGSAAGEVRAVEQLVEFRVAGVVVTPLSVEVVSYLRRQDVPVIEVDRQFADGACDAVVVDNRSGAFDLTRHLLDLGHRRIALLVDETDWTTGRGRVEGYRAALAEAGLDVDPDLVVTAGWSPAAAGEAATRLLRAPTPPTALFAANNVLAEGAFRAVADLGLSIPDDVSLVAFDDPPWMSMVRPGVTVVAQDAFALGQAAVERLLARIAAPDAPPRSVVLPARVQVRGSTAPPKSSRG